MQMGLKLICLPKKWQTKIYGDSFMGKQHDFQEAKTGKS
jgi:hypothetical protein